MNKSKRVGLFETSVLLGLVMITAICLFPRCGESAEGQLEIGYIMPMTGPAGPTGDISLKGAQFAVDKINAEGGIKSLGGRKLKLLVGDSEGKPEVGVNQAERLIRGGVIGLQGTFQSGVAYAATAVAERHKVPFLVSMGYGNPVTKRGFKYTFRSCTDTTRCAADTLAFGKDLYKAHGAELKTAVCMFDDTYGKMLWESVEPAAKEAGIKVVDTIWHQVGSTDLTSDVVRVKKANADGLFIHAYASDGILLTKTFRDLKVNPKAIICFGSGPKVQAFIDSLGKLAEYQYVLNDTNWDISERARKVGKEFKDRYGIDFTGLIMYEYISIMIWREVLEKTGSVDRNKIRDTFAAIEIRNPEIVELLPYDRIKFGPDGQNVYLKNTMAMLKNGVMGTVWPREKKAIDWVFPAPTWEERLKAK